jgi:hypothetical protein
MGYFQRIGLIIVLLFSSSVFLIAKPIIICGHISAGHYDSLILTCYRSMADYIDYDNDKMRVVATLPDEKGNFRIIVKEGVGQHFVLVSGSGSISYEARFYCPETACL